MQMLPFVVEYLSIHVFKHLFTVSSVVNTNLLIFFVFESSFRFSIVDDITFTLIGFNIEYCCVGVDDLLNTIHKNVAANTRTKTVSYTHITIQVCEKNAQRCDGQSVLQFFGTVTTRTL